MCAGACQKIAQAQCPSSEPYTVCVAGCQIDMQSYQQQCSAQVSAWMSCFTTTAKVACSSNGDLKYIGCESQLASFLTCAACIPSSGDDPCDACTKNHCCSQLKALYAHPQFAPYLSCIYACSTDQCQYACYQQYSGLQAPITQLYQCQGANCAAC
jgi:hypothetical protein